MSSRVWRDSLLFVEGTWVTHGPVIPAMTVTFGFGSTNEGPYVFSRMEGNRLALVPYEDRRETVLANVKDSGVHWVETTRGNIPRGAIKVGDGENKFIGKKHYYHNGKRMSGGYVTEDGQYRRAFACVCNYISDYNINGSIINDTRFIAINIAEETTTEDRFLVLCVK